jgi:diaminohydroxyphosphoribosylaminopyrimidine deaminase/5-amino-6-(5-phosphoribosylamino)uracil reductase
MQKNVSEDKNELNSYCRDLESMGARLVYLPVKKAKPARFDLDLALATLQRFGIYSLLLEGGAGLYQSFLNQNLVNKVYAFQAPQIMSGHDLLGWGQDQDASVMNLERVTITPLRNDWLLEAGVTFKG